MIHIFNVFFRECLSATTIHTGNSQPQTANTERKFSHKKTAFCQEQQDLLIQMLFYVQRDSKDYLGRGAPDDFHTAPELSVVRFLAFKVMLRNSSVSSFFAPVQTMANMSARRSTFVSRGYL